MRDLIDRLKIRAQEPGSCSDPLSTSCGRSVAPPKRTITMDVERLIGDLRSLRAACRAHNRMPTGAEVCQSAIDALAKLQAENTALKTQRRPEPYRGDFGPG